MLLKNKTVFVYDVEVFPNLFTCTLKNTESGNIRSFEIGERRNELSLLPSIFLNKRFFACGYNNTHYDDLLINYLLLNYKDLIRLPYWEINQQLKQLNDQIISSQKNKFNGLEKYKYANLFESLDLLAMLYSNKLRVGLKEMEVTLEYPNVLQYDGDFNQFCPVEDIDKVIEYNINDVNATETLLNRCQKDIELRLNIEKEYNLKALNKDGVNLGMEILKQRYLAETGLTWDQIKDLRSPCDKFIFKDIIFDFIEFQTPELQKLLAELKTLELLPGEKLERKFWLGGSIQVLALGGIHSQVEPEPFEPASDECLVDWDVKSMYPSIILEHKVYPRHLGEEFLHVYAKIRHDRLEAKKNHNKVVDDTLKLSLNGLSGNLQSEYSWCYDPLSVYKIRINGQLMLLMLAEALTLIGCRIIQLNTDGAFVLAKKKDYDKMLQIKTWWEQKTKLELEEDRFERFYQFAINDYVGIKDGWSQTHDPKLIKRKGMFLEDVSLGKGMAPRIIAYAVNKELIEGIPCEKTIKNCQDIKMFLTYQKVSKDFDVEYAGKIVQHINRYYISLKGYRLSKVQFDSSGKEIRRISMCNGGVIILNKFEDEEIPIEERAIDYRWYITEAKKILLPIKTQQLTLF